MALQLGAGNRAQDADHCDGGAPIPASGGDTASTPAIRRCFAVYPRERGRYCFHSSNPKMLCGLSPRAGEILLPLQQSEDALRFIPRERGRYCFHGASSSEGFASIIPRAPGGGPKDTASNNRERIRTTRCFRAMRLFIATGVVERGRYCSSAHPAIGEACQEQIVCPVL